MKKYLNLIVIFFMYIYSYSLANESITVTTPDTTTLIVKLFYMVIGAIFSYWFYFIVKNYIKYMIIVLAIYTVSLILLEHFDVIKLNINSIEDYINELIVILLFFYNQIQSKLSFTLGVIIGLLYALQKDNKIDIPLKKKENKK